MNDTHPDAERVWNDCLRAVGVGGRLRLALEATHEAVAMAKAAIAAAHPSWSDAERDFLFLRVHYGDELANRVRSALTQETAR